ncbi:hypothetical protein RF11_00238 [Thelohanellus kitauei]|uniref:Uncharacterized protein n=1 Tax=Thelohanellus kitauei TaxID=669202 RepID=A0A0C2JYU3_THEKT|nr:hypothetical protein RF11_00238 [Thelohanellus kitauei]
MLGRFDSVLTPPLRYIWYLRWNGVSLSDDCPDIDLPLLWVEKFAVSVRAFKDNFDVIEELLVIEALHSNTEGRYLLETFKNLGQMNNMEWEKLVSIGTNGAEAMMGRKSGCPTLLQQFLPLCGKTLNLNNVMYVVVRCVNNIRSSALNRREFWKFISEMNEEYDELLLHHEVRWLSKG